MVFLKHLNETSDFAKSGNYRLAFNSFSAEQTFFIYLPNDCFSKGLLAESVYHVSSLCSFVVAIV